MKFSVIVPVFNSKRYLCSCLESIRYAADRCDHQVEIIVVDNGSTDGSWSILVETGPRREDCRQKAGGGYDIGGSQLRGGVQHW